MSFDVNVHLILPPGVFEMLARIDRNARATNTRTTAQGVQMSQQFDEMMAILNETATDTATTESKVTSLDAKFDQVLALLEAAQNAGAGLTPEETAALRTKIDELHTQTAALATEATLLDTGDVVPGT